MGNSNSECKISIDTDENGNSTILLPDCTTQKLYDGEYCSKNFKECFRNKLTKDGNESEYCESIVPIRVYKKTIVPNAKPDDGISVLTTLILLPETEVYSRYENSYNRIGRAEKAYVYSQLLHNSRIRKNNKFRGINHVNIDYSVSEYDKSFVYTNGTMVKPKEDFYCMEFWKYDTKNFIAPKEDGIHFYFNKLRAQPWCD